MTKPVTVPTAAQRNANRKRQALWRKRQKQKLYKQDTEQVDDPIEGSDVYPGDLNQIAPGGLIEPGPEDSVESVRDLMAEQAIWVHRRRLITELELRRRKGELILVEDAKRQIAAMARRVRAALDRAPSLLPSNLSPEDQAACAKAMAAAITQALACLE